MSSARAALALAALCVASAPAAAESRGASLGVRGSFDAGSVSVSGIDHGFGAGIGVRAAFGSERTAWEVGLTGDIAGYTGSGDGDPILQLALLLSRRSTWGAADSGVLPYWKVGAGLGLVGLGASGATLPLHAGLGLELSSGKAVGLDVAIVDRLIVIYGGGSPPVDFLNGVGLEIALRFGR